jgi:LytR cell envelope-related transcriptional attenuator
LSKRRLRDKLLGSGERQRNRRKLAALQVVSWSFVAVVALFVVLLGWQFVDRTMLTHPISGELNRPDLLVRQGERIQMNVLNGSGHMRLAQTFTDYLRARKFDVVQMDNYKDTTVARTFVIDRVGDSTSAQKIAYALGVEDSMIRREIDTEEYVKADLVIGRDYPSLNPMK